VFSAWLLFLTNTVLWQIYKKYLYENLLVSSGRLVPIPATLPQDIEKYLKVSIAIIMFFYTGLWLIKFSFLAFFRRLGTNVKGQKLHWWIVFIITFVTWIITFGTIEYRCLAVPFDKIFGMYQPSRLVVEHYLQGSVYCTTEAAVQFQRRTLFYNMAMDVITDTMSMVAIDPEKQGLH
jgi:hypothetical protein